MSSSRPSGPRRPSTAPSSPRPTSSSPVASGSWPTPGRTPRPTASTRPRSPTGPGPAGRGEAMNILALNPGSGTLRYKLLAMPRDGRKADEEAVLKDGNIDHVHGGETVQAAERAVADCLPLGLDAIGYRVVHGGSRFDGPARITPEVLDAIRTLGDFAPLHNPIDLAII